MMDLVCKFLRSVELVQDTCAATLATVKAFSQLPEQRRLFGCGRCSRYFLDLLPSPVKVYISRFCVLLLRSFKMKHENSKITCLIQDGDICDYYIHLDVEVMI